jgi:Ca-activated chloride channel family protein
MTRTLITVLGLLLATTAVAAPQESEDKTLSPYFFVKSDDPSVDQLPLLATSADVSIAGVIADVRVTQVYRNSGKHPLEAVYVFPASTRAAVYAMKMTIGTRTIVADIREREKARQEYEQARQEGKSASLLEQERPNVFQMSVANIMPGDNIKVEMNYTELLVPTSAVYEFVYPTVVGPRYQSPGQSSTAVPESGNWVASPYQHQGEKPLYDFGMSVGLAAGMPIQDIACPSHKTSISYDQPAQASVRLDPSERDGGNRDFILKYRLAGKQVASGLLLYPGKEENFFLMMLQPPQRVAADRIPAREYIFIMDVSGSMHGYPIDISKKLLGDLISKLRPTDCFNVLLFAGGSNVMSEQSLPATAENIHRAINMIDHEPGGGGTELLPALKRALSLPRARGGSRTVVIATDGYVTVEAEAFDLIRNNLGKANLFAFGIGTSVNRLIIEGMAHVGMGEPFVVTKREDAETQADKFRQYVLAPVLTDVKVAFSGFDAYDVEPPNVPDVLADRPVIVFGKYRGAGAGRMVVTGQTAGGEYSESFRVSDYAPSAGNSALRYLWARQRIQLLSDYNKLAESDARVKEVTQLGLKYSLLTQYTSFVAIDRQVRNAGGKTVTVEQPLPLPQGVSDYAVGGGGGMGYGASGRMSAKPMADARSELLAAPVPPAQTKTAATVKLSTVDVSGGIVASRVRKTLAARLPDITRLYRNALKSQPGISGTLTVKFTILPDGHTDHIQVTGNGLNQTLTADLEKLVRGQRFENLSGVIASATIQFTFNP